MGTGVSPLPEEDLAEIGGVWSCRLRLVGFTLEGTAEAGITLGELALECGIFMLRDLEGERRVSLGTFRVRDFDLPREEDGTSSVTLPMGGRERGRGLGVADILGVTADCGVVCRLGVA